MKKLLVLLFLFTAFTINAFAQYNFIIFTEQGEPFWLVLNGVKQNTDPQTNVKVTGLNASGYKMKVIFKDNNLPDLDKNLNFMNPGEFTFDIHRNKKGEYVLGYISEVPIAANPQPVPNQYVVIYGSPAPAPGTVTQTTTTTTTTHDDPMNENVNMNMGVNLDGSGMNLNVNVNDGSSVSQSTTTTTTTQSSSSTTTRTNDAATTIVYVPGYSGPVGCPMPMAPADFAAAKNTIAQKSFETTKLDIAKQIVGSNCLVADQVKDIMQLFDFETSKLDFAKFAYGHTYDKGNYFKVNDAFEFESSVGDLNSYISGR